MIQTSYTVAINELLCMKNTGAQMEIDFSLNEGLAPMAIERNKILGAVLELPAKQHCQFSPFGPIFVVNGRDWQ